MKKLFLMLGVLILFIGGVIATVILVNDNYAINKVEEEYQIWKKIKTFDEQQLIERYYLDLEREESLENKIVYIRENYVNDCIESCPNWCLEESKQLEIPFDSGCIEECSGRCEIDKESILKILNDKLNEVQTEINLLIKLYKL